ELSALPSPIYQKEVLKGITHTVINTSRGCPYACEYCAVIENFGRNFRFINIERTVELIEQTLAQSRKTIFFGDDNFTAIPSRTKRLMEEILRRGIKMPPWLAQVRVESAGDKELLKLMKRAGCGRVCIGFESINEETLKLFNKHSSLEKNTLAIERFHEAGISIHGMFIIGADTDTKETIKETVGYAKKNRIDTAQFTLLVPLPGTKTTAKLEAAGRVISHDWHLYDGHHILVQPKTIPAHELYQLSSAAWLEFYSLKEGIKHLFYGNDHWFNFLVRIWGSKLAQKFIEENSYYRKALASLDEWIDKRTGEYDLWLAKIDGIATDAKINIEERRKAAKLEMERIISMISEKRRNIDDYFAPYKQKFLKEIEARLQQRLIELALLPSPSAA
ncbi:MAG: radical SAM protein, partial [Deltaproteobacteria bacterium]|nr:radical SAM protein [Deltaproteobacteria bacterium]